MRESRGGAPLPLRLRRRHDRPTARARLATPQVTKRTRTKLALFFGGFLLTGTLSLLISRVLKTKLQQAIRAAQEQRVGRLRHQSPGGRTPARYPPPSDVEAKQPKKQGANQDRDSPDQNWLDPKLSHPPDPVDLANEPDWPATEWQAHRWNCLVHIRQWQFGEARTGTESSTFLLPDWIQTTEQVLLVDPAYHANVGDHMITVGEQAYVQHMTATSNQHRPLQECGYFQAGPWAPPCDKVIAQTKFSSKLAIWHGGGNWGDLWDTIHRVRTGSLRTLLQHNYTIVGMPQSLYFQNLKVERINVNDFRQAIVAGLGLHGSDASDDGRLQRALKGRLLLTWREQESLDRARLLYPYVQHVLMPDIAFQLGPYNAKALREEKLSERSPPRVDILFFLRNDHESLYQHVRDRHFVRELLSNNPKSTRFTYSVVDWPDRLDRFESNDYYFTDTSIQLLDTGKVIICDRLHAAILAYLSGIPFVFVDQISGKITKTFQVAMQSHQDCQKPAFWERAENIADAVNKAALLWEKV